MVVVDLQRRVPCRASGEEVVEEAFRVSIIVLKCGVNELSCVYTVLLVVCVNCCCWRNNGGENGAALNKAQAGAISQPP